MILTWQVGANAGDQRRRDDGTGLQEVRRRWRLHAVGCNGAAIRRRPSERPGVDRFPEWRKNRPPGRQAASGTLWNAGAPGRVWKKSSLTRAASSSASRCCSAGSMVGGARPGAAMGWPRCCVEDAAAEISREGRVRGAGSHHSCQAGRGGHRRVGGRSVVISSSEAAVRSGRCSP